MRLSSIPTGRHGCGFLLLMALLLLGALLLSVYWRTPAYAKHAAPQLEHDLAHPLRDGESDGGDEIDIEGLLVAAPPGGANGVWVIQTEQNVTVTLIADATTRIDPGIPIPGSWVEARYLVQPDGTLLATRLRPDDYEAGELVVRLATHVPSDTFASGYGLLPAKTLLASGHIYLLRGEDDDQDIEALASQLNSDANVIWAEPNYVGGVPEGNPYKIWRWGGVDPATYSNQFAFEQINLAPAQELASGAGVVVAILDTGIDRTHPAFAGRLLDGWDMVADDSDPQEAANGLALGHGTHVAGIIAHVAPGSDLLPVRVLDANGLGNTFTLAYAIEWSVQQGADVINLSLGAEANSRVLQTAVQYASDEGVVIVAAAGNNNSNQRSYPVAYDGVIGVTAVDESNHKATFANYGAGWVDLAAPGVGITSTIIGEQGSGYASWSGSSMSTAFVSGAAALVQQKLPGAAVTTTLELLRTHGVDLDPINPDYTGQIGHMLDLGAALAAATPAPSATATPSPTPSATTPPTPTLVETPIGGGNLEPRQYLPLVRG